MKRPAVVERREPFEPEFILIPAGEFLMGSPEKPTPESLAGLYGGKADEYHRERPQHGVRITKPFYFGKYEVTQAQWQAVMGSNPSRFNDLQNPVECVSWEDVQPFFSKVNATSAKGGMKFALPTEAQWEYACRGGTTTWYQYGDDPEKLATVGNVADGTAKAKYPQRRTIAASETQGAPNFI